MAIGKDDTWEIYKDAKGQTRWRRTAPNGRIVGASTEGYVNPAACEANAVRNGMKKPATKKRPPKKK